MPFFRKYNTLLVTGTTAIRIPIIKRGVVDFAVGADWTPAAGDVKVFVDAAGVANITNLPTAIASGNTAQWEFILTAAELSCKQILVMISDSATKVVEDQCFIVETYGNASAMYAADLSLANLPANVTQLLGTAWLTPTVAGTPDVNSKQLGGTAQTGRDLGASVLLSSGTGTGQVSLSSGAVLLQPTQTGVTIPTVTTLTNAPSLTTADKQQLGVIKQITVSGAGNTTTVIESSNLSETDSKAYVGNLINCAGATNAANKVVTLKIIKFDPTTDRITLGGILPAALTVGDTCNILMDTLR